MKNFFFIFFLFSQSLFAQEPSHYFVNIESGLPTNEVYEILLSKKDGMLYAATNKGLARYNGSTVEEIEIPDGEELSITSLDEDKYGNIFFVSFQGGIYCYDGQKIFLLKKLSAQLGYPNGEMLADSVFLFSRDSKSFYTYHAPSRKLDSVTINLPIQNKTILTFYASNVNKAFIRMDNNRLSFENGEVKHLKETNLYPLAEISLNDKNYFIGLKNVDGKTNEPLQAYYLENTNADNAQPIKLKGIKGVRVLEAKVYRQQLYVLTEKGVFIYDKQFKLQAYWFSNLSISFIQQDAAGTIWLSTLEKGLIAIPNSAVRPTTIFGKGLITNFINNGRGISYTNSKSEYGEWPQMQKLKTALGGRVFMYRTNQFKDAISFVNIGNNFLFMPKKVPSYQFVGLGSNLKWLSFFTDTKDHFTSTSAGFSYYGNTDQIKDFTTKYKFDEVTQLKGSIAKFKQRVDIFKNKTYTHYYNPSSGFIYVGTRNGLYLFTPDKKQREIKWKQERIQSDFLYPSTSGEIVWSGGRTGLYKLKNGEVKKHWATQQGLLKTRIDRLRQQGDTLLLIFEKGVQLFTEKSGVFATYSAANYLPKAVCIDALLYQNELYVSTTKGVFILPIQETKKSKLYAAIASLWSKNKKLEQGKNISFSDNSLRFKINGSALNSRGNFTYEYRLLPADTAWTSQVSTNNEIRFNSLREGRYTLEVKLQTSFNESEVATYDFTLAPPWYRSWWFYILCVLGILLIIGLIFYSRLNQIRKAAAYDKRIKQSEITAIKAQMNPHFVFNALNSVQNLVIKKDFENTNEYLGMFSDLVRKTLEHSGKNEIALTKEIEMLRLYLDLEQLRFGSSILVNFDVQVDDDLQEEIKVPPMLVQPYIENVFKHGLLHKVGDKQVDIVVEKKENQLWVEITDNGIGRKKSAAMQARNKSAGFSTSANQKRMDLLNEMYNEKIKVQIEDAFSDREDCGTRVSLQLPITNTPSKT